MEEFLSQMKEIQKYLLFFIEEEKDSQENFIILVQLLKKFKITERFHDLKSFLLLLSQVAQNHCHSTNFYDKIETIFNMLKKEMLHKFTSKEIFDLFSGNKRIILFFLNENYLKIDKIIEDYIFQQNECFYLEQLTILNEGQLNMNKENQKMLDTFKINRKIGENDDFTCQLIRNDSIDQFISYVNQKDLPLTSHIKSSIFETNKFLMDKKVTLIEYAAFFGSAQIFKYLYKNNVKLTSSLWIYAIHSDSSEIIQLLEENKIKPNDNSFKKCLIESIKCHHNEMANV